MFRKIYVFLSSGEGRKTPTVLDPSVLRKSSSDWGYFLRESTEKKSMSNHVKTEIGPVSVTFFSSYLDFRKPEKVQKLSEFLSNIQ
jgi:hypothetical protein